MDTHAIRRQIGQNLVKQGLLQKQSKFLKELRSRWIVLTTNYLMCFRNQDCVELTDIIDLKQVVTIKSHFSRTELGTGFKLSSDSISLCFRCTSTTEKWCWLVALERTVELKQRGTTVFNNQQLLRTKGFPSVEQYEGADTITIDFANIIPEEVAVSPRNSFARKADLGKESRFTEYLAAQEMTPMQKRTKAKSHEHFKETVDKATQTDTDSLGVKQPHSPIKKLSRPAIRPKYTEKQDIINSQFMVGLFDQFEAALPRLKKLILDLLIQIVNVSDFGLNEFLLCECRVHPNSPLLADMFTSIYTHDIDSEGQLAEAYVLLQLILQNISDFFSYEQLQHIKALLVRSLTVLKRQGSLLLAISNIDLVDCLDSYTQQESIVIAKTVGQLQRTVSNGRPFQDFLKNFHQN